MTETNPTAMGLVMRAMHFAADKHRFQRRKDEHASPYINHPIDLANLLANEAHIADPIVIAAAILHDTVEDTETSLDEIEALFGVEIRAIVAEVTDDKALPKAERKRLQIEYAPRATFRAQQLKFADKICNVRDVAKSAPSGWSLERQREYFDWAKRVVDAMRGPHQRLAELFDDAYKLRP
jgi:GTP diphosphokinase / guanosine-3',5'-bis(diphosphate) 3'-diphosphatase